MLSRNASWPVEFVLKNTTPVELLGSSGLTPFRSTRTAVAFSCCSVPLLLPPPSVTRRLCPSTIVIPFGWSFNVRFPVSVAFIVAVVVVSGGIIVLLPTYDTPVYVSLIGLKLVNLSSPVKNRLPKKAFETLLVAVVVFTASCSPPTDVVVAVVLLPVVEADTRVVVDARIIVSVKIVATRWMLRSRGIFLLRLFSIPILRTFQERNKG